MNGTLDNDIDRIDKLEMMGKWIRELSALILSGKTYREACEKLSDDVALVIALNPEKKQDIVDAWTELFDRITKMAKEYKE